MRQRQRLKRPQVRRIQHVVMQRCSTWVQSFNLVTKKNGPSIMHATGRRRAGNSRPRRCSSAAKLSGFCNNVAATKFEIRIPTSEIHEVAELTSKHKAGNLQTSGYE